MGSLMVFLLARVLGGDVSIYCCDDKHFSSLKFV